MTVRASERVGAAVVRAVSGVTKAEFRAQRVTVADQPVPLASPYLALDLTDASEAQRRGVADAVGLLLRHSDRELHHRLSPDAIFQRLIFDVLEQLRCESLAPPNLEGMRRNLRASFQAWSETARSQRMHESFVGLLLFTVLHMARHRMIDPIRNELDEDIIETTRGRLGRVIGGDLRELKRLIHDQEAFAVVALRVAAAVAELGGDDAATLDADSEAAARSKLNIPDWNPEDDPTEETGDAPAGGGTATGHGDGDLLAIGGYHVFTSSYDAQVTGEDLYRPEVREGLRVELDRQVAAQAVSVPRLALRLQRVLTVNTPDGWRFGTEDGLLDARRLPQLVANPAYQNLFKQPPLMPSPNSAVTFLVDNSGSMKIQRYQSVAVLVDTFSRAMDRIGVANEVLGFSTRQWNGGRALKDWHAAGGPDAPGRLSELQHVVYKAADESWRRSRRSLSSMMRTHHFRESVDGEALIWAYHRLLARPEERKILVVVSDGAPMDSATANANGPRFLRGHLQNVAHGIERRGDVELSAISIDADLSDIYSEYVNLDLNGTLTLATYSAAIGLFR